MTPHRSKPEPTSAATGAAGRAWRPSPGRLAVALALATAGLTALFLVWMPSWSGSVAAEPVATAAPLPAPAAAPAVARTAMPAQQARAPEGDADPTRDLSSYVARGANPSMSEVIEQLHQRGIHSGLGAFSPPGTSPPLVGLAVPEDFVLPKGYVRHHQATDDGQRIEAILMFAPDFQLVDAANAPVAMPANRVVPAELAPHGLPIRRIVIPPSTQLHGPGR